MDTEIRKDNKIPGCEQLTRPEEIAALSKYLGNIKKVQEEHTELGEDSLEVPGRTTGRIPKIDELENTIIPGEGNIKSLDLENTRLSVGGDIQKINLENKVEELKKPEQLEELPDTINKLRYEEDVKLDHTLETLKEVKDIPLSTTLEKLEDKKELENLSDFIEVLSENKIEELETKKESLIVESNPNLSDFLQKLSDDRKIDLENEVSRIYVEKNNNLDNTRINLNTDDLNDLRQNIDELYTSDLDELRPDLKKISSDSLDDLRKSESHYLGDVIREANSKLDENGLYDLTIKLLKADGSEWADRIASLISTYLGNSKIELNKAKEFEKILANSFVSSRSEINSLGQLPKNTTGFDNELNKNRIDLEAPGKAEDPNNENDNYAPENGLNKEKTKRPENKHQHIITDEEGANHEEDDIFKTSEDGYINSGHSDYINKWFGTKAYIRNKADIKVPEKEQRSLKEEASEIFMMRNPERVPAYNVDIGSFKDFGYKFLNGDGASSYLRYVAEKTVGNKATLGSLRTQLLNEVLALLIVGREKTEQISGTDRSRLPGPSDNNFFSSLINNGLSFLNNGGVWEKNMSTAKITSNVLNLGKGLMNSFMNNNETTDTPFNRPGMVNGRKVDATYYGPNKTYDFRSNYIAAPKSKPYSGLNITLQDLCEVEDSEKIVSVDDFRDLLRKCELITTSNKITGVNGNRNILTLDSDIHWEVVLEPYLGEDEAAPNGGISYLPSIKEINVINENDFGHNTAYNKWIPISSFELQKSKLTTKTLGLFDGEIAYPITTEFTNEVRIGIIDDQYKSWRHYFQKCADVSVYSAEPHMADFYQLEKPLPTAVDKSTFAAAYYKNITFRIKIFVMTPQYFTIRKMDLLCVLRDFSEDYHGEYDSAGSELSVVFSVVGELGGPSYAEKIKRKEQEVRDKGKEEEEIEKKEQEKLEEEKRRKAEEARKKEVEEKAKAAKAAAKNSAQSGSAVSGGDKAEYWYVKEFGRDIISTGNSAPSNQQGIESIAVYTEAKTNKKYIMENGKKSYLTYKPNSRYGTSYSSQTRDLKTGKWIDIPGTYKYDDVDGTWISSIGQNIFIHHTPRAVSEKTMKNHY